MSGNDQILRLLIDRTELHTGRGILLGLCLARRLNEIGYFQKTGDFLKWCSGVTGVVPMTVRASLDKIGIWENGIQGSRGGPHLLRMQNRLVDFAEEWMARIKSQNGGP